MGTEHTQGSLTKEAIRLAWPAVCESFFIALAGMVDTFMVSTLGANAVAAVGLTTQPKFLGLALFIAANVAISALVASTISVTLIRTAASYIFGFTLGLGMTGIWMGILADQVSRFLFASIRFRQGKWVTIKI
jgi:Na+-driven multidrug efflux pump